MGHANKENRVYTGVIEWKLLLYWGYMEFRFVQNGLASAFFRILEGGCLQGHQGSGSESRSWPALLGM